MWSESPFYGYFLSRITKKSYIWNQHPQIFLTEKLHKKPKLPYFVTKNSWLVFFSPTKPYLGILGEELFRKVLSHLKTAPSNLPSCKILRKKNCLTWGPKMTYFQIFGLGFQNNSCHIWNQHPHICLIAKCHEKTINLTSWTKRSWLVAFDQECLTWMFERKIKKKHLLRYLKSAPSNLSNLKIFQQNHKCVSYRPKAPYLSMFGLKFSNSIVVF